jgi:hypothetical protein
MQGEAHMPLALQPTIWSQGAAVCDFQRLGRRVHSLFCQNCGGRMYQQRIFSSAGGRVDSGNKFQPDYCIASCTHVSKEGTGLDYRGSEGRIAPCLWGWCMVMECTGGLLTKQNWSLSRKRTMFARRLGYHWMTRATHHKCSHYYSQFLVRRGRSRRAVH